MQPVLALVVVLDQHKVGFLGHLQQGVATLDRHGDGGRALVAGRHIDVVAAIQRIVHLQAAFVDGQIDDAFAAAAENVAGVRVARRLQTDRRVAADQQIGQQVERLLGADSDDDFLVAGPYASTRQHPRANLLDQRGVVAKDHVLRPLVDFEHAQGLHAALAPVGDGEERAVELAVEEGVGEALPVGALLDVALLGGPEAEAARPFRRRQRRFVRRRSALDPAGEDVGVDEVALALARDQIAFVDQLLVGDDHRIARHAELGRHVPARRDRRIDRMLLVQNGRDQHLTNLPLQAEAGVGPALKELVPLGGVGLCGHRAVAVVG